MGTLVCLHAHPDDEAIGTGGMMARAHAEGHRVVLIVATNGEHGEIPDDLVAGQSLAERRAMELQRSAEVLGVDRTVSLGFKDSGMTGWPGNDDPASFWQADVEDAARRVAGVLREEAADVLTFYDWHGGYGHPDHVQVHRVGAAAARMVRGDLPTLRVFESTMNRDEMRRGIQEARDAGMSADEMFDPDGPMDDGNPMGTLEAELTMRVDVSGFTDFKRRALIAHSSQVSDSSFFLQMPADAFRQAFGTEWLIEHGQPPGPVTGWIFDP